MVEIKGSVGVVVSVVFSGVYIRFWGRSGGVVCKSEYFCVFGGRKIRCVTASRMFSYRSRLDDFFFR